MACGTALTVSCPLIAAPKGPVRVHSTLPGKTQAVTHQGCQRTASNTLKSSFTLGLFTPATLAGTFTSFSGLGLPLSDLQQDPQRIGAATLAQVDAAATEQLDPQDIVVVMAGPETGHETTADDRRRTLMPWRRYHKDRDRPLHLQSFFMSAAVPAFLFSAPGALPHFPTVSGAARFQPPPN